MQYLPPAPDKINSSVPFRTWDGRMVVAVSCGGWRPARPLDLALLPPPRWRLVLVRDMED